MSFFMPQGPAILGDSNLSKLRVSDISLTKTIGPYTSWKLPVKVATTADNILSGFQTIDSKLLASGDRVLVKNQVNGIQNGIYVVNEFNWLRSNDLELGSKANGIFCYVGEGTTNANKLFVCTNVSGLDIVGMDSLDFLQYAPGGGGGGDSMVTIRAASRGSGQNLTGLAYNVILFDYEVTMVSSLTYGTIVWDTDHFVTPVNGMYRVTVSLTFNQNYSGYIYVVSGSGSLPVTSQKGVFQGTYVDSTTNFISLTTIVPVTSPTRFIRVVLYPDSNIRTGDIFRLVEAPDEDMASFNQVAVELISANPNQVYPINAV